MDEVSPDSSLLSSTTTFFCGATPRQRGGLRRPHTTGLHRGRERSRWRRNSPSAPDSEGWDEHLDDGGDSVGEDGWGRGHFSSVTGELNSWRFGV